MVLLLPILLLISMISGILLVILMAGIYLFNEIKIDKEPMTIITSIMFIFAGIGLLVIITIDGIKLISELL